MTLAFVDEHRRRWPVRLMCAVLGVSVSARSIENRALLGEMQLVHEGTQNRQPSSPSDYAGQAPTELRNVDFSERRRRTRSPSRRRLRFRLPVKGLPDLTYVRTSEGWLFLAAIIDMVARKVVGWSIRETLHAEIALEAWAMAIRRQQPEPGLVHHSDSQWIEASSRPT